jgi:hypothetical protein
MNRRIGTSRHLFRSQRLDWLNAQATPRRSPGRDQADGHHQDRHDREYDLTASTDEVSIGGEFEQRGETDAGRGTDGQLCERARENGTENASRIGT